MRKLDFWDFLIPALILTALFAFVWAFSAILDLAVEQSIDKSGVCVEKSYERYEISHNCSVLQKDIFECYSKHKIVYVQKFVDEHITEESECDLSMFEKFGGNNE